MALPLDMEPLRENKEPDLDNDLEERLLSVRNLIDLTLLALREDRHDLIPTGIEETYLKIQWLLEDYCVVGG